MVGTYLARLIGALCAPIQRSGWAVVTFVVFSCTLIGSLGCIGLIPYAPPHADRLGVWFYFFGPWIWMSGLAAKWRVMGLSNFPT